MTGSNKIAVLFPGIGYNCSRPLLYYAAKLAESHGYELLRLEYHDLPENIRGNRAKMEQTFRMALEQTREALSSMQWSSYTDVLFISKSVGTIVAGAYASEKQVPARHIAFTPLVDSFLFLKGSCILFHGTKDPWAKTESIREKAEDHDLPLYLTEGANHSLETTDVFRNIEILSKTMQICDAFMNEAALRAEEPMVIRLCTKSDQMAVTHLYNDVVWNLDNHVNYPKWVYNEYPGYETVRLAIDQNELYGCFIGEQCIGAFVLNRKSFGDYQSVDWSRKLTEYDYLVIHTLAVDPKNTRRGYAKEMIRYCIETAKNRGMQALRCDVVPENLPCRKMLEGLGFTCAGEYDLKVNIDAIPKFAMYELNWEKRF